MFTDIMSCLNIFPINPVSGTLTQSDSITKKKNTHIFIDRLHIILIYLSKEN